MYLNILAQLWARVAANHKNLANRIDKFGPAILCGNSLLLLIRGYEFSTAAALQGPLHQAFGDATLIDMAYFLGGTAFTPLVRSLVDHCEVRAMGVLACAVNITGSCLAGIARSQEIFILGRVLMAIGSVILYQVVLSYNIHRAPAGPPVLQAITWSFFAGGFFFGPLVAGALADHVTWRWAFFITMPILAAVSCFLVFGYPRHVVSQRDPGLVDAAQTILRRGDICGSTLWICLLALLYWACSALTSHEGVMHIALAWSLFALCLIVLIIQQVRHAHPQATIAIFRKKNFSLPLLCTALASVSYGTAMFYTATHFNVSGEHTIEAAIGLMPLLGAMIVTMVASGFLLVQVHYLLVFALSAIFIVCGALLQQTIEPESASLYLTCQALVAAGLGLTWQAALPMIYVMARSTYGELPEDLRVNAVALNNIAQMGGVSVSMAAAAAINHATTFLDKGSLSREVEQAVIPRYDTYITIAAGGLGLLGAACMKVERLPRAAQQSAREEDVEKTKATG